MSNYYGFKPLNVFKGWVYQKKDKDTGMRNGQWAFGVINTKRPDDISWSKATYGSEENASQGLLRYWKVFDTSHWDSLDKASAFDVFHGTTVPGYTNYIRERWLPLEQHLFHPAAIMGLSGELYGSHGWKGTKPESLDLIISDNDWQSIRPSISAYFEFYKYLALVETGNPLQDPVPTKDLHTLATHQDLAEMYKKMEV